MVKFYSFIGRKSELTDVFYAARIPKKVRHVIDGDYEKFFYVIPWANKRLDLFALWFLFLRNGVVLKPHNSKHYGGIVLRVRDKHQKFMCDVCEINHNPNMYQEWIKKYNKNHQK